VRRRLFTLAALLSLVLCVAVAVLWVRSYWSGYYVSRPDGPATPYYARLWMLTTGRVLYLGEHIGPEICFPPPAASGSMAASGMMAGRSHAALFAMIAEATFREADGRKLLGFDYRSTPGSRRVVGPLWPLALALSILPVLWLRRRLWHTFPAGHCASCGYDLRETPQRCPECGPEAVGSP
jgi:hypothetical protein